MARDKLIIAYACLIGASATASPSSGQVNAGASSSVESGEAGARAGTNLYNNLNPLTPLPSSADGVVTDTVKNLGARQTVKEAWRNAAEVNAAVPKKVNPKTK